MIESKSFGENVHQPTCEIFTVICDSWDILLHHYMYVLLELEGSKIPHPDYPFQTAKCRPYMQHQDEVVAIRVLID